MRESSRTFHNLEWPPEGSRLSGPVVWLRGWVVGKPGTDCIDLRVRHAGRTHLGVLGLPRTDLAAHFGSKRSWLPAEFILGVPAADGPLELLLEVMDADGCWHALQRINLTVAPDGAPPPRIEGRLEAQGLEIWTIRDAHHPFHGHLDEPGPAPAIRHGRIPVFGWLLDETRQIATVLATTDTLVFNHLEHSLHDEALAEKVPQHGAARHARLRGAVDLPATVIAPVCLRVYAVLPDGSVHLCFAQRLRATPAPIAPESAPTAYAAVPPRVLPALPSGRPRRLLLVTRSLLPDDATLRALDLARHLTTHHRWAARLVCTEDGPLRRDFEQTGVESLVVDPGPLFAAAEGAAMERILDALQRQIRWDHLDAVAVFDPVCGWAITLARRRAIPVLFDCTVDEPMEPDPTASATVQSLMRESWRSANAVCFASEAAARAQSRALGGRPAAIVAHWHSPDLPPPAAANPRVAFVPLRTADWLVRHHPTVAGHWNFRQGPAGDAVRDRLASLDDAVANCQVRHTRDWSIEGVTLCLGSLFGRGPIRPLLDAAAAGVPLVVTRRPTTEEIFGGTRLPFAEEDNPLALAHALLACDEQSGFLQRETAAARTQVLAHHAPGILLAQWENLLAAVAAERG